MIGRGLPAPLLYELHGVLGMYAAIDEDGAGEQNAAANTMFAVDDDTLSSVQPLLHPFRSSKHLFNRKRSGVWCGQVQEFDALFP